MNQSEIEPGMDQSAGRLRSKLDEWPRLSAFCRLVLVLVGYSGGALLGLSAVCALLFYIGPVGTGLAKILGGSWLANVVGYVVALVLLLASEVGIGITVGWVISLIIERWPDNPITRLIQWVKDGAEDQDS